MVSEKPGLSFFNSPLTTHRSPLKNMHFEMKALAPRTGNSVMVASVSIPAGEASDICTELERVDFNEYLTGGKDGVYMVRVVGDSMETEIRHGDLVVVNRNLQPNAGDVVIASVNGAYTVKIYQPFRNGLHLVAANSKYKTKTVTRRDSFEVFGVVTDVLHSLRKL